MRSFGSLPRSCALSNDIIVCVNWKVFLSVLFQKRSYGKVLRLSHSGKAVAGKALEAQEAGKRSNFLSKNEQLEAGAKPAGFSPFSNWDISPYTGSGFSDMVVDGALKPLARVSFEVKKWLTTMPILSYFGEKLNSL